MSPKLRPILALILLDRSPEDAVRLYGFTAVSLAMHAAAALLLVLLPLLSLFDAPLPVAIELIMIDEPEPEPAPPETEPVIEDPEPPPEPEPVVRRARPEPPPETIDEPPPPEPPPLDETVADFTGETLTNDTGASWASAVGDGRAIEGPLGRPGAVVTGRERRGARDGAVGGRGQAEGTALVPLADLSRRPVPPSDLLVDLLRAAWPRQARNLGIEGSARVRLESDPQGRIRVLGVISETYEGFGRACAQAVRRSGRWGPGLDHRGDGAATRFPFRCTFQLSNGKP